MKTFKKNILTIAVLALVVFSCKNEAQPEVKTVETSNANKAEINEDLAYAKAEFTIEGMTCEIGCAKTIEKRLAKMDGVKSAKIDFEKKLAMVEFDDSKLNTNTLESTVTEVADIYTVKNMKTVDMFEAKGDIKKDCKADCTKACCKDMTEAEKKACAEDCKKACCASKA